MQLSFYVNSKRSLEQSGLECIYHPIETKMSAKDFIDCPIDKPLEAKNRVLFHTNH